MYRENIVLTWLSPPHYDNPNNNDDDNNTE